MLSLAVTEHNVRAGLQRTINAPEDFTFGAAEKEATIRELREEIRIVRSRMENNPEVKRYAGAPRGNLVWASNPYALCSPAIAVQSVDVTGVHLTVD